MHITISSKFQVVIPKDIRRKLGLKPSQKLLVMEKAGILYMVPQAPLEDLKGSAAKAPVTGYREKDDRY